MRILVIRHEPPWPLSSGGTLHAYELCRRLAARHELLMIAERAARSGPALLPFECRVAPDLPVRLPGGRVERFFGVNSAFGDHLLSTAREFRADLIMGMNYLSLPHLARFTNTPTLCDLGDDEVLHRWLALRSGSPDGRWKNLKCLAAACLFERRYIPQMSAVTVLSELDRLCCRRLTGHARVEFIAHGVDVDHYHPANVPEDGRRIIFWGGLGFGPNLQAVRFFGRRVWPLVLREEPQMKWTILGRPGGAELSDLRDLPGATFEGFVEDIRPHVARAGVAVVPMVSGAGIKNKILEAWAMGKAVVCTPRALGSLPGEHGRDVWLAESPAHLATAVVNLARHGGLRRALGEAGRRTAVERCTWDLAPRRLEQLCLDLVRKPSRPRSSEETDVFAERIGHAVS